MSGAVWCQTHSDFQNLTSKLNNFILGQMLPLILMAYRNDPKFLDG